MGELRRLYYQTKEKASFKTFKWVLKGRWNQGTGNSGNTRTYQEWDELGISYEGSDGVKYGPTYWTVDSFSSSGTPFAGDIRGPADLFDGEWGSETSKCDYSGIDDTNGYVEIIIHTTSGQAIIPNGVGLISSNNHSSYASSTPAHFILYGLDESTNEYVQLIDVGAASVNKGNTQTTTVSFEPIEVVSGTHYLLAPSDIGRGVGLRTTVAPKLVWYNDSTEQSVAGRGKTIDLSYYVPESSSFGYITWIFDGYIEGSHRGAARLNLNVRTAKNTNDINNTNWGMYDHNIYARPAFLYNNGNINTDWHTADGETSKIVTLESNKAIGTTYWNSGTYGTIKIAFDRANRNGYFYMNGNYLGYRSNIPFDPIELCAVRLYSDLGYSSEVAKCKNLKIAAFATLDHARNWDGTI